MHHDSRAYLEFRYDGHSCDVIAVVFRDRGILPIEVITKEFSIDSPVLGVDALYELRCCVLRAYDELHSD